MRWAFWIAPEGQGATVEVGFRDAWGGIGGVGTTGEVGFWDAWGGVDDQMVKPVGSGVIEGLRDGMGRGKKNQVNSCRGAVR